jgi:hypothetical protein
MESSKSLSLSKRGSHSCIISSNVFSLCVIHTRERNIFIDGERGAFAARHQRTLFLPTTQALTV